MSSTDLPTTPDPTSDPSSGYAGSPAARPRWRRRARWGVPAVAVIAVAGAVGVPLMSADASPTLPTRTAAQLLASIAQAQARPFSGTVVETARLGLPDVPGDQAATDPISLLTGSHTMRVWYGGPGQTRLALVGDLAESDLVRNGPSAWLWSSQDKTATHYLLPAEAAGGAAKPAPGSAMDSLTPAQAADNALKAVDPTTTVSVDGTARVAGRSAYQLILAPKDTRSLVSSVRLAVDAKTFVPLRVQVFARGHAAAAFETGFTSVTFSSQPSSVFRFTAPPGTKVTTKDLASGAASQHRMPQGKGPISGTAQATKPGTKPATKGDEPTVIGSGWTAVVELKGVQLPGAGPGANHTRASGEELGTLLKALTPVSGAFGAGRELHTSLVSILLLDNGTAFVGSVSPSVLQQVAATAVK